MIKKVVKAVKNLKRPRPKRIPAAPLGIQPADIDPESAAAVQRLQNANHETYIVGGAVRDLLLGFAPKDFDICTEAKPEEVRKLFKKSRIIGRRFRIVHVYRRSWRDYMEVTTFRADGDQVVQDEQGRIVADNYFGDAVDDALRRDFTCNALFYNPATGKIIDYVGGVADIEQRRLVIIGNANERFREDPVRMLRALRIEAKLGLVPSEKVRRAIRENASLLADIAPSRLFDEAIKMIKSGASDDIFYNCQKFGTVQYMLPAEFDDDFAHAVLREADKRYALGRDVSVSFVLAGLFWPPVARKWHALRESGMSPVQAMEDAAHASELDNSTVPKRLISRIMDLYFLQARFESRRGVRSALSVMRHKFFDRAIRFAELRLDEGGAETAQWWQKYRKADSEERKAMSEK